MARAKKILIVDDERSLVQLCQIILEAAGFEVRGAYNGYQALNMITEEVPDLILLDVMMPGIDGIEVCKRIRSEHERYPRIVMYTADERDATLDNSIEAGANAVLTKETPVYDIPAKIANYLVPTGSLQ
ncbi:MAG TPA: response regulator [Candidatus Sulfomarinibacteraceae bacterium]|nr:response regulator [Candidatus Sulfomarinibacteraceae bacterium]